MMSSSSSSTIIHSCCYILMVLFITSTCAYVIDSEDLRNSLTEQQLGLNSPLFYDRFIRTTKFPRIGRSPSDLEDISYTNSDENEENENESRWIEQRSVLFPRIGKRAFHSLLLTNSLSNPHRMLDAQGRYHINGYGYHIHQNQPQPITQYRSKRDISM